MLIISKSGLRSATARDGDEFYVEGIVRGHKSRRVESVRCGIDERSDAVDVSCLPSHCQTEIPP